MSAHCWHLTCTVAASRISRAACARIDWLGVTRAAAFQGFRQGFGRQRAQAAAAAVEPSTGRPSDGPPLVLCMPDVRNFRVRKP